MNGLSKQLFIPNCLVAQSAGHKTENLRRTCWPGFESKEFAKLLS